MKEFLKISWIEMDIVWENPQANFDYLDEKLENLDTDLVVLPEMFTTGFSMNAYSIAEPPFGKSYNWMKSKSLELNAAICGSISTEENGKFFNRMYFVTPTETFVYDKKHLFGFGNEPKAYSPGDSIVTVEYLGWKFRLSICYDLRFPVWCRNSDDYDALICIANWPEVRIEAWKSLLKARAIENMAYAIGVNRTGVDGYDLVYNGNSKIYDPIGHEIEVKNPKNSLFQTEISLEYLKSQREKFGFLEDRDNFLIK